MENPPPDLTKLGFKCLDSLPTIEALDLGGFQFDYDQIGQFLLGWLTGGHP